MQRDDLSIFLFKFAFIRMGIKITIDKNLFVKVIFDTFYKLKRTRSILTRVDL